LADGAPLPAGFTIALIAAGQTGAALAGMAAQAGFRVVVEDLFPSNLRKLADKIQAKSGPFRDSIFFSSSVEEAVRDADFVIDLVPDELESKLEIFSMLDRMAPPRTILCSPMRDTSVSDLQACTYRADRCIAIAPPEMKDWQSLAEATLIAGKTTSEATIAVARDVWQRMGKQVRVVHEGGEAGSSLAALPQNEGVS
jgi:3-hydroxybutyryl-CoA dehydrogenase